MNGITYPTNDNVSPHPRETVTGIETGTETGKGIGTEIAIGETPLADDMGLRHHGSGIENVREMLRRGDHTRKKKKRKNHQSHYLPLSPGSWARCPSRQSLMVGVSLRPLFTRQR
jgi:hypothetical protein